MYVCVRERERKRNELTLAERLCRVGVGSTTATLCAVAYPYPCALLASRAPVRHTARALNKPPNHPAPPRPAPCTAARLARSGSYSTRWPSRCFQHNTRR